MCSDKILTQINIKMHVYTTNAILKTTSFCGDFVPQTSYRGFGPGPHYMGDFRPSPDSLCVESKTPLIKLCGKADCIA